jgi:hypothetical protein
MDQPPPDDAQGSLPEPPTGPGLQQGPIAYRPPPAEAAKQRRAAIFVTVGALLVIAGVFLPWITASGPAGSASINGIKAGTWGTLILGVLALARGLSMLRPDGIPFNLGTPIVGGVLLAVLLGLRWGEMQDAINRLRSASPDIHASLGIGVWANVAGTALILLGGVLARVRARDR